MFRKIMLGLVAAGSLGLTALSPTAASASYWGWHGHHPHFHGHYWRPPVMAYYGGSCIVKRWVKTPWGYKLRKVNVCY